MTMYTNYVDNLPPSANDRRSTQPSQRTMIPGRELPAVNSICTIHIGE